MGQLNTLVLASAGSRCARSDYGAMHAVDKQLSALPTPLYEFSNLLRSRPFALSYVVSSIRPVAGKGGLRHVA